MPEVGQVVTVLSGFTGAPGYSSMYFFGDPFSTSTAGDAVAAVYAYWNAVAVYMSPGSTFAVRPDVNVLDEATGALLRTESTTPAAQSTFPGSTTYAAGVGAVSTWNTAAVHRTKHLRGRTFVVPLGNLAYEGNGTLSSGALSTLRSATNTLAAEANFGVWGRPRSGAGGDWAACTGGTVRDQVAWLSTRRT